MYPEFIAIYIGLGVLALLQIVTIVLLILVKKSAGRRGPAVSYYDNRGSQAGGGGAKAGGGSHTGSGIAFCTNCGNQFPASLKCCPICGKSRS